LQLRQGFFRYIYDKVRFLKLQDYISKVDRSIDSFHEKVMENLVFNEEKIISTIQDRLYEKGLDAKGYLIGGGDYRSTTIEYKIFKGQRYDHFTLFDTGSFYAGMFVVQDGDSSLLISSQDSKTSMLEDIYGTEILNLSEKELRYITDLASNYTIQDFKFLNSDIDIDV